MSSDIFTQFLDVLTVITVLIYLLCPAIQVVLMVLGDNLRFETIVYSMSTYLIVVYSLIPLTVLFNFLMGNMQSILVAIMLTSMLIFLEGLGLRTLITKHIKDIETIKKGNYNE